MIDMLCSLSSNTSDLKVIKMGNYMISYILMEVLPLSQT